MSRPTLQIVLFALLVSGTVSGTPAGALAQGPSVTVVVESEHASVTPARVRAAMNDCGVSALSVGDAPAEAVTSLAIVFRAPGALTRFRLSPIEGDPSASAANAPESGSVQWIARRACRMVLRAAQAQATSPSRLPRPASEVLNPWGDNPSNPTPATNGTVTDPWRGRARTVGSVAGAAVAHFSEVLDPWSNTRPPGPAEVLDPWANEGAEGLARPRNRRRR